MPRILIVYYTRTGNTEKMAKLVEEGAKSVPGVEVITRKVEDVAVEELLKADGIILGSPTYYGSAASPIRTLIDKSVKFHGQLEGKVGAAFASSGNVGGGNETTILNMLEALLIHGMIVQGDPRGDHYGPVSVGVPDDRASRICRRLGERTAQLVVRLFGTGEKTEGTGGKQ